MRTKYRTVTLLVEKVWSKNNREGVYETILPSLTLVKRSVRENTLKEG